jgi:hypothetical protein
MENSDFAKKALSHIPMDIIDSMRKQTAVKTAGLTGLEAIQANDGESMLPKQPSTPPTKDAYVSVAVDGKVVKISLNPTEGAVTMLLYLLATVWSKDKKIAKILKQFNFRFMDANGAQLYPPVKNAKK